MAEQMPHMPPGMPDWMWGIYAALLAVGGFIGRLLRPNYKAMAEAFFAQKAIEDEHHRNAIIDGFERAVKSQTRDLELILRDINTDTRTQVVSAFQSVKSDTTLLLDRQRRSNGGSP